MNGKAALAMAGLDQRLPTIFCATTKCRILAPMLTLPTGPTVAPSLIPSNILGRFSGSIQLSAIKRMPEISITLRWVTVAKGI